MPSGLGPRKSKIIVYEHWCGWWSWVEKAPNGKTSACAPHSYNLKGNAMQAAAVRVDNAKNCEGPYDEANGKLILIG